MHSIPLPPTGLSSIRTLYGLALSTLRASIGAPAHARQAHYMPPARANLIGRLYIACSGTAARRLRACARLNHFASAVPETTLPERHQHAQQIALHKLHRAAQGASPNTTQQMLEKLSDQALHTLWQHLDAAAPANAKLSVLELSACHAIVQRQQQDPQTALAKQWHAKAQQRLTAHMQAQRDEEQQRSERAQQRYGLHVPAPMLVPAAVPQQAAGVKEIVSWAWGVQLPS